MLIFQFRVQVNGEHHSTGSKFTSGERDHQDAMSVRPDLKVGPGVRFCFPPPWSSTYVPRGSTTSSAWGGKEGGSGGVSDSICLGIWGADRPSRLPSEKKRTWAEILKHRLGAISQPGLARDGQACTWPLKAPREPCVLCLPNFWLLYWS